MCIRDSIPATAHRLLREIRVLHPDLVHIIKPRAYAGLVQWWLWQRRRCHTAPIVLDIDDWEQAWSGINHYPRPVASFLAWQEEWGIRHATAITAASKGPVERAASYTPPTPILYLPNGVADPACRSRLRPAVGAGAVLFFTRFVEVTPAWLGTFVASLHAVYPQMHLIIAGAPVPVSYTHLDVYKSQALRRVRKTSR